MTLAHNEVCYLVCKDPNPQEITSFVRVPIQERPARVSSFRSVFADKCSLNIANLLLNTNSMSIACDVDKPKFLAC